MTYGWSRKKMLASLFQLYGFQVVPLGERPFMSMLHGPSSIRRPIELEHPGPDERFITSSSEARDDHTPVNPHHDIV